MALLYHLKKTREMVLHIMPCPSDLGIEVFLVTCLCRAKLKLLTIQPVFRFKLSIKAYLIVNLEDDIVHKKEKTSRNNGHIGINGIIRSQ